MGVIREALTASCGLFTVAFVVGYYLEYKSEEVITRLVNKVLDDPRLEDIVFDYASSLLRAFLSDPFATSQFEKFAAAVVRSPEVQGTVEDLIVQSVLDQNFLKTIATDVLAMIKKRKPDLGQLTERRKILESTFEWKPHQMNYLALALRKLDHFNFDVSEAKKVASDELALRVFRPGLTDLTRQTYFHLVEPFELTLKLGKTLKKFPIKAKSNLPDLESFEIN